MTIKQLLELPLEEQFKQHTLKYIESYYYLNEDLEYIHFNSPFEKINQEFNKLNINTTNKSIFEINQELLKNKKNIYSGETFKSLLLGIENIPFKRYNFLTKHLEFLEFYLYDYKYNLMTEILKEKFKNYREFIEFLRKMKL